MAWTTPRTWITGEVVTAALMNTHVRDDLAYLHGDAGTTALASRLQVSGKDVVRTAYAGLRRIESSKVTLFGMQPFSGNTVTSNIVFSSSYGSAPTVTVGMESPTLMVVSVWATSVTATGFTVNGTYTGGGATNADVTAHWIAEGIDT